MDNNSHLEFLQGLINGNRKFCINFINDCLIKGFNLIQIYELIIKQSLYDIGELWEYNKISVATEHLASAVIESILYELYNKFIPVNISDKKVIVTCVEKEKHQIGARMVAHIFEKNGWNVYFLGADTPTHELIEFAKIYKPDTIAISTSIYFHIPLLEKMLIEIRKVFPNLLILIGGQAFRNGGNNILTNYNNIRYLSNLNELDHFIK
jgi:MerR family transcriptional regulator, light-induced transcriptional regulator